MSNIELVIGTVCPNDSIESLDVDFLPLETRVRVPLTDDITRVGTGTVYGTIVGVRLDTGRRGSYRWGAYRRSELDIAPNVVSYIVREDTTKAEYECAPSKVCAQ